MWICDDCQPAGITAPRLDDMRGRCEGCGTRCGNLRRYIPSAFISERGHYVTATGRVITTNK